MSKPTITTVGQSLFWSYGNLAIAHTAVGDGVPEYGTKYYVIRNRLYSGLLKGSMSLGPFSDEDRLKMILPQACAYCGGTSHLSLDHVVPKRLGGSDSGDKARASRLRPCCLAVRRSRNCAHSRECAVNVP